MTRNKLKGTCLLTEFKPRIVKDTLNNESWIEVMNEEIEKIERNNTWTLVPRPKDKNVISTKWVFFVPKNWGKNTPTIFFYKVIKTIFNTY